MNAELKKARRSFWVILLIVFLGFIGISIPYLIFPPLFLNPEYSILPSTCSDVNRALLLGVTLAAYPLGQFIGSPILGSLSDVFGRKKLLGLSLLVTAISTLLSGLAIGIQGVALLVVSRFFAGLMEGNIAIARVMAADLKLISKQESFGKINAVASIAYLVGPLIGGLLADEQIVAGFSPAVPFFFCAIVFVVLAVLSFFLLPKQKLSGAGLEKGIFERFRLFKRVGALLRLRPLGTLLLVSTCFTLGVDIFYEFGPVYLTVKWLLTPAQLILYNGVVCVGLIIGNGWLPKIVTKWSTNRSIISVGMFTFGMFLLGMIGVNSVVLMGILLGVSGLSIGAAVTTITTEISDVALDEMQGEVMGTQLSLRVLGDAVICLFGGGLLILSPRLILVLAVLLSFIAMGLFLKTKTERSMES